MLLKYGKVEMELNLPEDVPYKVLKVQKRAPLEDPIESLITALHFPTGSLPLKQLVHRGESVCIIVNDSTRISRSEIFIPILIDELLKAGMRKKDLFICFANGTHRPLTEEEMISLVGKRIAEEIAMYNHYCEDINNLAFLGYTSRNTPIHINKKVVEADRRILTGSVIHHYFAGFGGGRKTLVPGVAGLETIQKNHSLLLDKNACRGRLRGNPVHEDLLEAAQAVGADFIINTVLDESKEFLGIFTGDLVKAHEQACILADEVYGIPIERQADVVIASCGGYPKDINLFQSHKTLDNAISALKNGGKLILLAECPEGIGEEKYEQWASRHYSLSELEKMFYENFVLGGHKALTVARLLQKGEVYLISSLPPEKVKMLGFIPSPTLDEAIAEIYRKNSDKLFTYIIPQGSITAPKLNTEK